MSRIGKLPIPVPGGVDITIDGREVTVKGPKGQLSHSVATPIEVAQEDGTLLVRRPDDERSSKALHGLTAHADRQHGGRGHGRLREEARDRRHRVPRRGQGLEPRVRPGLQPPITIEPPDGVTFRVEAPTRFSVSGIDKQQVGEVAANLRKLRKPDPYKGKGVRYAGEQIRRKVGKAGKKK
jgi:large subunit ribosomal protein L6